MSQWLRALCISVFALIACSDDPPSNNITAVCTPGTSNSCACTDGSTGAQICADGGGRFLACVCEGMDPEPDANPDPQPTPEPDPESEGGPENVLLIIADDLGLDATECYGATGTIASTPNIRALCDSGVVFEHAWVAPTCSPTRATMLTGRYPMRHGVGAPVGMGNPSLGADEVTLPRVLNLHPELGVAHASIGKWHLTAGRDSASAPNDFGWDHYAGIIGGTVQDFFAWTKTVDGATVPVTNYATTELVDDAVAWIGAQEAQDKPWLMWLAFNAPHTPFHAPPSALHSQDLGGAEGACPEGQNAACYRAAIEAMDTELGRLLGTLSPQTLARTHIIYLGDNGTPPLVVQDPVTRMRSKSSLYEGGVRVPFVVSGPAVVDGGRSVDAIIDASDVFATVLEMAGMDPVDVARLGDDGNTIDAVSIVPYLRDPDQAPLRQWVVTELNQADMADEDSGRAIRDARFKLILFRDGREALYDLGADPWESAELIASGLDPEGQAAYDILKARLEGWLEAP